MIALDTNVLVYAHRREVEHHDAAKSLVTEYAEGGAQWAIPWPCIYEFYSVVTNPRIWKESASTPKQASRQIRGWLDSPTVRMLSETAEFFTVVGPLMNLPRVRGAIIHDARVAALCLAHGIDELLTADRDFQLFPGLKTRNPFPLLSAEW
ncbi:MAG: type II toxin-antitoxin system VapC family toxin [Pseudomonadales bacterium]